MEKFVSIRYKLIRLAKRLLLGSLLAFLLSGATISIYSTSQTFSQLEDNIRRNLIRKGTLLVSNNSLALRGMAEDNAFSSIEELVASTVHKDSDVLYGIYMDANRQPWVIEDINNPDSTVTSKTTLNDSLSVWASIVTEIAFRAVNKAGIEIIEFSAPVVSYDERLGTIRYGLTTSSMQEEIRAVKQSAVIDLLILLIILIGVGGGILSVGSRATQKQANQITKPLRHLTDAADKISRGDYSSPVHSRSNDELGNLAHVFETMRQKIKRYTEELEHIVEERTQELKLEIVEREKAQEKLVVTQKELVEKAHMAGMADIATGVLHNVGNIINSVNTSAFVMRETLEESKLEGFFKANAMLKSNIENLEDFISTNPQGSKLIHYYLKLEDSIQEEYDCLMKNAERMIDKLNAINDVIIAQQNYAKVGFFSEQLSLEKVLEDALTLQTTSITRHEINITKKYKKVPKIWIQRAKLVHIIVNLYKNAKEAMKHLAPSDRKLTVELDRDDENVYIRFSDNGQGINPSNFDKIFTHGFTTKPDGHGFGLHSCANYMTEMGGKIWVEGGKNKIGATFVLSFPLDRESKEVRTVDLNADIATSSVEQTPVTT